MPHAHHATAVTDDTFSVIGDRPHITIMKSNLQLYKIMTDVLWCIQIIVHQRRIPG